VVEGGNNREKGVKKGSTGSTLKEDHATKAITVPIEYIIFKDKPLYIRDVTLLDTYK
jgi:hypothetical protein